MEIVDNELLRKISQSEGAGIPEHVALIVGAKIIEDSSYFDLLWPELETLIDNTGLEQIETLFDAVVLSENRFNAEGRTKRFLQAVGWDRLWDNKKNYPILGMLLSIENKTQRAEHICTAWPVVLDLLKKEDPQSINTLALVSFKPMLISCMKENYENAPLELMFSSCPDARGVLPERGGPVGSWVRECLTNTTITEKCASNILQALLDHGCNLEQVDNRGLTPLEQVLSYELARFGVKDKYSIGAKVALELLIEAGANWKAVEKDEYETTRELVYNHPKVKAERLAAIAHRSHRPATRPHI